MSMVHLSSGMNPPASEHLLSEPEIVARLAAATLPASRTPWLALVDDYDRIRERIARVVDGFDGFVERVRVPGGFRLDNPAARREWHTTSGRASLPVHPLPRRADDALLTLMTIRSHDQYNTTIYGFEDRYRGVSGERRVVFANAADLARLGFAAGQWVDLVSVWHDGDRVAPRFLLVAFDIPRGCLAAYFPETNALVPLDHHAAGARTPAAKAIPVRLRARADIPLALG